MRVVLDTNVLVSAIVFGGPPETIIRFIAEGRLQLVLSPPILEELRRVLREKFLFSDVAAYRAEALLRRVSSVVEPGESVEVIDEDPPDNRILEAAVAGSADIVVSGDRHLLRLRSHEGIPIVTARQLLESLQMNRML